jgi:hypothetical protein
MANPFVSCRTVECHQGLPASTDTCEGIANTIRRSPAWRDPNLETNSPKENFLFFLQSDGNSFNDLLLQSMRCLLKIPLIGKVRHVTRACNTFKETKSSD